MFSQFRNATKALVVGSTVMLGACAEDPKRISPVYIPSIAYKGASCAEIARERGRLASYVDRLTAAQQNAANIDTGAVTLGLIIFWPAIAALPFTVDQTAQLAVARGHYDALVAASYEQGCSSGHEAKGERPIRYIRYHTNQRLPGDFPPM